MSDIFASRKAQAGITGRARTAINSIVAILVLFVLFANFVPEAQSSGDDLQTSGVPLGTIFGSSGFVFVLVMVGLLLAVIALALPGRK